MQLNEGLPLQLTDRVRALENLSDLVLTQLAPPIGVTVAAQGTLGATTYAYVIAALSVVGAAPVAAVQITNGNAALSAANFNLINFALPPGSNALAIGVYRSVGGATQGLIGFLPPTATSLLDTGLVATGNVPTANTTGCLQIAAPVFCNAPSMDGPLPLSLALTTGQTLTVAQILTPLLARSGPTAIFNDVTPSAAALVAALPGVQVGCCFTWLYRNTSAYTATLQAGAGVTLAVGNTNTTATNNTHSWLVVFTNVTPGSEAVTIYSLGSALLH